MLEVFMNIFNPTSLLLIFGGVAIGTIFGAIPGLNTPIAIALALPFTMVMGPVASVSLMMGIYMGGVSGGLVSAILLRIPGTAASIATVFDGYPMTLNGKSTEALTLGVFASFFGGMLSSVALLLLAPVLAKLAIQFGPWEYFGATLLALSLVCGLMQGSMTKGFIALGIGLLAQTVGASPVDGIAYRFTFGNVNLENGFSLIAVIIGVFALPEIINNASKLKVRLEAAKIKHKVFHMLPLKDVKTHLRTMSISSIIGVFVGILPGLGGGPAAMLAYATDKKLSKNPETFGKGNPSGVAASESANNATTGGALIPMLSLAVPGDTATAVIMGAFIIQGIPIGPNLSLLQPVLFKTIILAVFVANIAMFIFQGFTLGFMAKLIEVPKMVLMPIIVFFCTTGILSLNGNVFDLYYTIAFILLGYALDKNGYPIAPLIMGMVLGGTVEENLRRSIVYYGSFQECLQLKSIGTLFFAIGILIPVISGVMNYKKSRSSATPKA